MTSDPGQRGVRGVVPAGQHRRVVIVGGGFAGLFAARELRRANVSVTLIDRAEHHLFQPLLYQCATGILSEGEIAVPLRALLAKHKNVAGKPFRYRDLGSAAYISRGRAVVSAGPLRTGGFIAWWIWLFIHIAFLTGYRNRIGAVLTWWLAFTRDLRRERAFTTGEVRIFRDVYTHPQVPGQPGQSPTAGGESG